MGNKRTVLIGGTRGIGEALNQMLKDKGYEVLTIARSSEATYPCDVTDTSQELPSIEGPIHGLVYCPGTLNLKPFGQISINDFQKDWEINTLGAFRVIQFYLNEIQKAERASIVCFSTVAVRVGMPFHASVAAAKGAVEGLTRSLAAELCPKIRVNAIAPSLTDTPLVSMLLKSEEKREVFSKRHPLQKIGTPDDIALYGRILIVR